MLQSMGWQRVGHNLVTEQQQSDAESYAEIKAMTKLDNILKSKDIILPTKVHTVKAVVFQYSYMDVRVGP